MLQEVDDLREEGNELGALLDSLGEADWARPTPFKQWTVFDVVGHLHYSDRCALAALKGRDAFQKETAAMRSVIERGGSLRDFTRDELGPLDGRHMLELWRGAFHDMCDQFAALDPKARLPWFGPDMGLRMFTTARQMETWAHGQDVYDLLADTPSVHGPPAEHRSHRRLDVRLDVREQAPSDARHGTLRTAHGPLRRDLGMERPGRRETASKAPPLNSVTS